MGTVSFEAFPQVDVDAIVCIIEGYFSGGPPREEVILVCLTNGAHLSLAASDFNRAAVAAWRQAKKKLGYSG